MRLKRQLQNVEEGTRRPISFDVQPFYAAIFGQGSPLRP
jgi:hypothetical protein